MNLLNKAAFLPFVLAWSAHAHFVFVTPEANGTSARVFMSETLRPDLPAAMLAGSKFQMKTADGTDVPLSLTKVDDTAFSLVLTGSGTRVVYGVTELGVMQRGEGKPHRLTYYPKSIVGDPFADKTKLGSAVPVEIVAQGKPGALKLKLVADGKAVPDAEIVATLPDGAVKKLKTDANGETELLAAAGRYGAWARHWVQAPGELQGKKYEEVRNYATLVFDSGGPAGALSTASSGAMGNDTGYTKLPQATSSFGAAVEDGWLYVYGGHTAATHSYSKESVSGRFDRLKLAGTPVWESLPVGPALQGMNLAAHKGKIYRVGGMAPVNEKGKEADLKSYATAERFDVKTKKWEALPDLPEARSSHDLAMIGDKLMVVGGWDLSGEKESWVDSMAVLDLAAKKPAWTAIPQPFKRRALMAAVNEGKLYVIGGMNEKGEVERKVSIYDPKTNQWTDGPELPEGKTLGFAPAAGVHEGKVYVSVSDGSLLRMGAGGGAWEKVGSTTPRVAHRMASRGNQVLVIGGAVKGKNLDLVEVVQVK